MFDTADLTDAAFDAAAEELLTELQQVFYGAGDPAAPGSDAGEPAAGAGAGAGGAGAAGTGGGPAAADAPGPDPCRPPPCPPAGQLGVMPRGLVLRALASCRPGPRVMAELTSLDPVRLTADERIDYVLAWDRCEAWAAAGKQRALAACGQPAGEPDGYDVALGLAPAPDSPAGRFLAEQAVDERAVAGEVGLALRLGRLATGRRLRTAWALAGPGAPLADTLAALQDGRIGFLHALSIADAVLPLADDPARVAQVQRRVLARAADPAGGLTVGQTQAAARRAVAAVDPGGADRRHRAARAERRMWTRPAEDGMAFLGVDATAADIAEIYAAVDELARRSLRAHPAAPVEVDDAGYDRDGVHAATRTLDQRRVDTLVQLCRAALADPDPPGAHRRPGAHISVGVLIDLPTLAGLADHPGELAGHGPIPPVLARELAARGRWRRLVTDPVTGHLLDYGTTTYTPPTDLAESSSPAAAPATAPAAPDPPNAATWTTPSPSPAPHPRPRAPRPRAPRPRAPRPRAPRRDPPPAAASRHRGARPAPPTLARSAAAITCSRPTAASTCAATPTAPATGPRRSGGHTSRSRTTTGTTRDEPLRFPVQKDDRPVEPPGRAAERSAWHRDATPGRRDYLTEYGDPPRKRGQPRTASTAGSLCGGRRRHAANAAWEARSQIPPRADRGGAQVLAAVPRGRAPRRSATARPAVRVHRRHPQVARGVGHCDSLPRSGRD